MRGRVTVVVAVYVMAVFAPVRAHRQAAPAAEPRFEVLDAGVEYEVPQRWSGRSSSGSDPNSTDPLPAPLPAALPRQLGLKLEQTAGPLVVTIVDAAERPSPDRPRGDCEL